MNLLIVDDQPNVVSSLAFSIDWNAIGITNVFTASSSLLAKNIIKKNEVDILLTDIEMPIENGLSLIEWIRKNQINIACILLSAHADFVYAKKAIALNVTDYIVQPARNEDIIRAVTKAISQRKSDKDVQQILSELSFSQKEQNIAANRFFASWPDISSLTFKEELNEKINRLNALDTPCNTESIVYLMITRIDEWHTLPLECYDFIRQYKRIVHNTMSYLGGKPLTYSVSDSIYVNVLFINHSEEKFKDYLSLLQEMTLEELSCSVSYIYNETNMNRLGMVLTQMLQDEELNKTTSESIIKEYNYHFLPKKQSLSLRQYYLQITSYIDIHIEDQINRSSIAESIHVSSDYVSHIVREVAGKSCKELIAEKKMTYAKKMLETTSMQVGEVAKKCGYDSFAYFSKVYKSVNNQSPSETRQGLHI